MNEYRYIALLRGINVGGNSIIKMSYLQMLFESLGFKDVSTYIQSGNVIFLAEEPDARAVRNLIEEKLEKVLGYKISVFILTPGSLKKAAAGNPFDPETLDKIQYCQIMFLSDVPDPARVEALLLKQGSDYSFVIDGSLLYYAYPLETAGARRNINLEKILGVTGTSRSWKVVNRLIELSSE
ncbi:MAG: DUF1697 domain-containing protein [Brevinematales bacterium]|jgi:uncharacterized protein (DUF1697 family)